MTPSLIGNKPDLLDFAIGANLGQFVSKLSQLFHSLGRSVRVKTCGFEQVFIPIQSIDISAPWQAVNLVARFTLFEWCAEEVIQVNATSLDRVGKLENQILFGVRLDQITTAADDDIWWLGAGQRWQEQRGMYRSGHNNLESSQCSVFIEQRLKLGRVIAPLNPYLKYLRRGWCGSATAAQ